MRRYEDYPLLAHNTFGMDVRASLFVEYDTADELCGFLRSADFDRYRRRFIHIGAGSNLLFTPDPLFSLLDPQSRSCVLFFALCFGLFVSFCPLFA